MFRLPLQAIACGKNKIYIGIFIQKRYFGDTLLWVDVLKTVININFWKANFSSDLKLIVCIRVLK